MANILVAASPAPGHLTPMLSVAQHLSSIGHSITFLSGTLFRDKFVAYINSLWPNFVAEESAPELKR